jgi:hypothetical protein
MTHQQNAPPRGSTAGLVEECSLRPSENTNTSEDSFPRTKIQTPFSATDGIRIGMIRELFAGSITIALGFGLNSLHAAQQGDDVAAIGEFRRFKIAAQTAGCCARELREIRDGGTA